MFGQIIVLLLILPLRFWCLTFVGYPVVEQHFCEDYSTKLEKVGRKNLKILLCACVVLFVYDAATARGSQLLVVLILWFVVIAVLLSICGLVRVRAQWYATYFQSFMCFTTVRSYWLATCI